MTMLIARVRSFATHEEGATYAEYVMLCVLIALGSISAVSFIGQGVLKFFSGIPALG